MNFEMEDGKYRYINGSSKKILFVQEQSQPWQGKWKQNADSWIC